MAAIKHPHDKQFKKGHTPWNKGIHVENAGTFKKGHAPTCLPKNGSVLSNGYRMITIAPYTKVYEHRHIMEQHLGRKLSKNEHVHHINYDKLDNRIENLEVLDHKSHGRESANKRWTGLTNGVNYGIQ